MSLNEMTLCFFYATHFIIAIKCVYLFTNIIQILTLFYKFLVSGNRSLFYSFDWSVSWNSPFTAFTIVEVTFNSVDRFVKVQWPTLTQWEGLCRAFISLYHLITYTGKDYLESKSWSEPLQIQTAELIKGLKRILWKSGQCLRNSCLSKQV